MEIFYQCFQYTPSNLFDFIQILFILADLNIGHYVELTFFEGRLSGIFVIKV